MTREEQRINAAREYNSGIIFSNPSNVLHFEAGAKWADEHPINVWHNASEEPTAYHWEILCEDDIEMCFVSNHYDAAGNWVRFCKDTSLVRWAYTSDLLPK